MNVADRSVPSQDGVGCCDARGEDEARGRVPVVSFSSTVKVSIHMIQPAGAGVGFICDSPPGVARNTEMRPAIQFVSAAGGVCRLDAQHQPWLGGCDVSIGVPSARRVGPQEAETAPGCWHCCSCLVNNGAGGGAEVDRQIRITARRLSNSIGVARYVGRLRGVGDNGHVGAAGPIRRVADPAGPGGMVVAVAARLWAWGPAQPRRQGAFGDGGSCLRSASRPALALSRLPGPDNWRTAAWSASTTAVRRTFVTACPLSPRSLHFLAGRSTA